MNIFERSLQVQRIITEVKLQYINKYISGIGKFLEQRAFCGFLVDFDKKNIESGEGNTVYR